MSTANPHRLLRSGSLVIYFLLAGLPLLLGASYALLYSLGLTGLLNEGFTTVHWKEVLVSVEFWQTIGFSLFVASATTALSLFLALWAVICGVEAFQRGLLSYLIYMPLAIPAMAVAFFTFQLLSKGGLLSRLSYQAGLVEGLNQFPDWVNDAYGVGIIFSHVFMATPFFIILFTSIYRNERIEEFVHLAATLGANKRQIARKVISPILINRSFPTLVLYFLFVMGSYEIPLLLGSQSPQMVSVLTIRKLQRFNLADIPQAYVISVVYLVIVIVLVVNLFGMKTKRITKND